MNIQEISKKYANIEEKVPLVWPDYEKAGIELAQDLATEWDVKDPELIRVISLVGTRVAGMGKPSLELYSHIYAPFAFMGLYPEKMKAFDLEPEKRNL